MMNADEHDFWLPVGEPTERAAEIELPPADPTPPPMAEVVHAAAAEPAPPDETSAQLTSLLQVSAYLVAVRNPDELIPHLVSQVVEALPSVQAAILWLYDRRNNRLRVASTHGLPLDPQTLASLHQFSCPPGEGGLAGLALLQMGPLLRETTHGYRNLTGRNSTREHAIFQRMHEQLPRTLTAVAVPLRVSNETNGVLELLNLGPHADNSNWHPLRPCNLPVLHTFGTLAAAALKNTQLYAEAESHRQRLNAFDAVVTAISTATDLHDMVGSVLDVIMELEPPPLAGAVLLLDPIHGRLVLSAHRGLPPAALATYPDTLFSGTAYEEVISYGHPVVRPLFDDSHEGVLMAASMASCAYLPLLAGGTVVGVLTLYGDATLPKNLDTSTMMPLCNQIGFAVANVQMYDDSQIKRRRLNTIMNSIAEGVLLCDRDGNLVLGNEAALYLLRLDSFPYNQPLSDWPTMYQIRDLDGENLPLERLPLLRALAGDVFDDDRVLLHGASGPDTVMSFSGAPAYADDGSIEGAVVILRDFTTKQKRERAKDEFLATAAHELRSPLAAVRSYADLLLRREQQREGDPRDLQGLTILSQQVTHMLRMVDNLLDLSRLDAGQIDLQPQRINLVSLATQVLDQQRPAAASIELALDSDEPELWLHGDPLRIRQVLTNLVGNAIKHSPADGHICVRLERVERTTATLTDVQPLDALDGDDGTAGSSRQTMVLVAVRDSGHGIPADQHALLFQRFFRARGRRTDGLGLGLYLSRQFVLMHGGSIWLESSEGKGSTFYFTLPVEN